MKEIFNTYVKEGTSLDTPIFIDRLTYNQALANSKSSIFTISMTISTIYKGWIQIINNSGVPCRNKYLTIENLKAYNVAIKRAPYNLNIFWSSFLTNSANFSSILSTPKQQRCFMRENTQMLEDYKDLDYSGYPVSQIPGELNLFANLTSLSLCNNQLITLYSAQFAHLTRLKTLVLRANTLTHLPPKIFAGLKELEKVIISQNNLKGLPKNLFTDQVKLIKVDLSHNNLEELNEDPFTRALDLQKIDLTGNKLKKIPDSLFYLKKLKTIYVDNYLLEENSNMLFAQKNVLSNQASCEEHSTDAEESVTSVVSFEESSHDFSPLDYAMHDLHLTQTALLNNFQGKGLLNFHVDHWIFTTENIKNKLAEIECACVSELLEIYNHSEKIKSCLIEIKRNTSLLKINWQDLKWQLQLMDTLKQGGKTLQKQLTDKCPKGQQWTTNQWAVKIKKLRESFALIQNNFYYIVDEKIDLWKTLYTYCEEMRNAHSGDESSESINT
jgi:hypothetical protein